MKLVLVLVVAIGAAVAAPALMLAPQLEPIREGGWGASWSSLALGPNVARDRALAALAGAVAAAGAAVLVVAALTVLSLAIARSAQRRSEIVVRRAVGASRRVLAGAALLEGGAIALSGLALGAAAAVTATIVIRRGWPGITGSVGAGPLFLIFGLGAVVVVSALLPLRHARTRVPGGDATGRGVPRLVPASQFAVALLALLGGAQLAARATPSAARPAAGSGTIVPLTFADSTRGIAALLNAALRNLRADSSIVLASLSSPGTLIGLGQVDMITTDCGRCSQGGLATPLRVVQATNHLASADTFRALGLRVVGGRALSDADRWGSAPVAVVSQYLAERGFEGGRAVGQQVRVGGADNWYRVVGIVEDGRFPAIGAGATPRPRVFLSILQHEARAVDLLVQSRGADAQPVNDAGLPPSAIGSVSTLQDVLQREADAARWYAAVLRYEGWGALLLAALGMFAVMRMWVAGELPELALRRALGATAWHIIGRVVARALVVAGGGVILAWWLEPLSSAALARAIAGVPAPDLGLVRAPLAVLLVAAVASVAAPAWRAARAAPATLPGLSDL